MFSLRDSPRTITVKKGDSQAAPLPQLKPVEVEIAPLQLLGYQADSTEMRVGQPLNLDLYWQAQADLAAHYQVSMVLVDALKEIRWEWPKQDPVAFYPTSSWQAGEIVRSQIGVKPSLRTPAGDYQLALRLYRETEPIGVIPLTSVSMPGRPRQFTVPAGIKPLKTGFDGQITLLGFSGVERPVYQAGDQLEVQLIWQPQAPVEADYTVFVQLLGPDGQVYGQMDSQPHAGEAPTSQWTPGEVIQDPYTFTIAADAPPGQYQLIAGLYRLETGERVKLTGSGEDVARLATLEVR
jgi:hypothetical protein